MAPDVRSSTIGTSFDFNSQAGVLVVLGAIRASELPPAERNELRDLVFLYSNGGGDPAVRNVLEERLQAAGITVATAPPKKNNQGVVGKAPVATSGFSNGRLVPVFVPVVPSPVQEMKKVESIPVPVASIPTPEPVVIPVQVEPESVVETIPPAPPVQPRPVVLVPRPAVRIEPVLETTPIPTPVIPLPVEVPPAPVVRVTPITPPIPESVVVVPLVIEPVSVLTSVMPPSVPVVSGVVPPVLPDTDTSNPAATARLERIRHIKSDVNSRVGNPVNLVDLDNVLGREYMSALLEAMKLIADAPEADANRAMNRLEAVYIKVQTLLDRGKEAFAQAPDTALPGTPITPIVRVAVQTPVASPVPVQTVPVAWEEAAIAAENLVTPTPVPVRVMPSVPAAVVVPPAPITSPVAVVPSPVQSVTASQVPLRSISELPTADEVNSQSASGTDTLFTKEVDAGLQQLLSEWSLFKKSGLFGTGPSGREHPLFLKIAPLQLPLLLAGRFEGSTQDIKQSVTDYMNGWRYEQGIVYEKEETFEHYLRRVIRHIIDLQNKKRGA